MNNFIQSSLPKVHPASDIIERDNAFYIYLDMPGVTREMLNIEVEGNELFVSATTAHGVGAQERLHSLEFGDVQYNIMLALSDKVDADKIEARMENGVLEIVLPKQTKKQAGRIKINVE